MRGYKLIPTLTSFVGDFMESKSKWLSCCRGRKSCPEVLVEADVVHIKDDGGNEVKLSFREFDLVVEVVASIRKFPPSK